MSGCSGLMSGCLRNCRPDTPEYARIDVSKKDLSVFDGKDLKFNNQEGLKSFKKYLKKKVNFSDLVIIFEPTGVYSLYLKEFYAENSIKAYIVNPKKSHNFLWHYLWNLL